MTDKRLKDLEKEVLQLPSESRASLAEKLIRSLETEQNADVASAWVQEVQRRYREVQEKAISLEDADMVFRKVREQL